MTCLLPWLLPVCPLFPALGRSALPAPSLLRDWIQVPQASLLPADPLPPLLRELSLGWPRPASLSARGSAASGISSAALEVCQAPPCCSPRSLPSPHTTGAEKEMKLRPDESEFNEQRKDCSLRLRLELNGAVGSLSNKENQQPEHSEG